MGKQRAQTPLVIVRSYEPDTDRMVAALRALLTSSPPEPNNPEQQEKR